MVGGVSTVSTASLVRSPNAVDPVEEIRPILPASSKTEESALQQRPLKKINSLDELKSAELQGEHYPISEAQLIKAIELAIKKAEGRTTSLQFSIHDPTKRIAVKVLDKSTGEVIREIPPEKMLDFVAKLWEMAGILIDERR